MKNWLNDYSLFEFEIKKIPTIEKQRAKLHQLYTHNWLYGIYILNFIKKFYIDNKIPCIWKFEEIDILGIKV